MTEKEWQMFHEEGFIVSHGGRYDSSKPTKIGDCNYYEGKWYLRNISDEEDFPIKSLPDARDNAWIEINDPLCDFVKMVPQDGIFFAARLKGSKVVFDYHDGGYLVERRYYDRLQRQLEYYKDKFDYLKGLIEEVTLQETTE